MDSGDEASCDTLSPLDGTGEGRGDSSEWQPGADEQDDSPRNMLSLFVDADQQLHGSALLMLAPVGRPPAGNAAGSAALSSLLCDNSHEVLLEAQLDVMAGTTSGSRAQAGHLAMSSSSSSASSVVGRKRPKSSAKKKALKPCAVRPVRGHCDSAFMGSGASSLL